jgi:hypothetical protein
MESSKEYKRKYKRLHVPFLIKILTYNYKRLDTEHCTCAEGVNISPCGISFKYPRVIEKDDHIRVLIHNVKGLKTEEIMANVKIVWAETKDLLSRRFGGKFVKIAPENKFKLLKLIRKNGR